MVKGGMLNVWDIYWGMDKGLKWLKRSKCEKKQTFFLENEWNDRNENCDAMQEPSLEIF